MMHSRDQGELCTIKYVLHLYTYMENNSISVNDPSRMKQPGGLHVRCYKGHTFEAARLTILDKLSLLSDSGESVKLLHGNQG